MSKAPAAKSGGKINTPDEVDELRRRLAAVESELAAVKRENLALKREILTLRRELRAAKIEALEWRHETDVERGRTAIAENHTGAWRGESARLQVNRNKFVNRPPTPLKRKPGRPSDRPRVKEDMLTYIESKEGSWERLRAMSEPKRATRFGTCRNVARAALAELEAAAGY